MNPERDSWPSVQDRTPADWCPHCEAMNGEEHQESCPLYKPFCACGRIARRYLHGEPICTTCESVTRHQGPEAA